MRDLSSKRHHRKSFANILVCFLVHDRTARARVTLRAHVRDIGTRFSTRRRLTLEVVAACLPLHWRAARHRNNHCVSSPKRWVSSRGAHPELTSQAQSSPLRGVGQRGRGKQL